MAKKKTTKKQDKKVLQSYQLYIDGKKVVIEAESLEEALKSI